MVGGGAFRDKGRLSDMDKPSQQFVPEHGRGRSATRVLGWIGGITLLAGGFLITIVFFSGYTYTTSVDLAWHYSLIEFIVKHRALPGADVTRLGPMIDYPPGAHVLVAAVASLLDVNVLRALFLNSVVAVFVAYLLIISILGDQSSR